MASNKKKVLIGLSGGVDSAVATHILLEQGYDVTGVMMLTYKPELYPNIHLQPNIGKGCFGSNTSSSIDDAQKVAKHFGIDFKLIDVAQEFKDNIIQYFISEYSTGHTPNPCIKCNKLMKFGLMLQKARESGLEYDYFATGHYARIEKDKNSEKFLLKKAIYLQKDQTYFLSYLPQDILAKTLMPLGDYSKPEVRAIASDVGLFNYDKTESQDFYTGNYNDIINMNGQISKKGNIIDISGRVLGKHEGITNYTIGQRKGLGVSSDKPLYVVELNADTNEVIVDYIEGLAKSSLIAKDVNWISGQCYNSTFTAQVKIRYRHNPAKATVTVLDNGDKIQIDFAEPQNAITPGQLACVYVGDCVICAGWIE